MTKYLSEVGRSLSYVRYAEEKWTGPNLWEDTGLEGT